MQILKKLLDRFDDWAWSLIEPIFTGGKKVTSSSNPDAKKQNLK